MRTILMMLGGFLVILGSLWGGFYTFHLWPIPGPYQWWYLPQIITTLAFGILGIVVGVIMIEKS